MDAVIRPRLLLGLFTATDLDALIDAAFPILRAAVPCDFASAFYRRSGDGLLRGRDSRGRTHSRELMLRHVELSPAIPLARAQRGVRILPTRGALPRDDDALRELRFYQEVMQPMGWRHSVALCFWGEPAGDFPIFVASVERRQGRRDFSKLDITRLERIFPFLDAAVNRVHEIEAAQSVRNGVAVMVQEAQGTAILDGSLAVLQGSVQAKRLCARWRRTTDSAAAREARAGTKSGTAWRLPMDLADPCREMLREWQAAMCGETSPNSPPLVRRVSHPTGELDVVITIVRPGSSGLTAPLFVLRFNERLAGPKAPLDSNPVLKGMTAAERAVALALADGASNQEIADRLGKSVYAVKFLLHRVFGKAGVTSRAALVAVLRNRAPSEHAG